MRAAIRISLSAPSLLLKILAVLQVDFDGFNRHWAIGKHRNSRNLAASINSFSMNRNFCVRSTANAGTTTLPPRFTVLRISSRQFWPRIGLRMQPVAIRGFHHQQVLALTFCRPVMQNATRRDLRIVNTADITGEQQLLMLPRDLHRHFHHRRSDNVRRTHKAEREVRPQLFVLIEIHCDELRQARLCLFKRVERQRWIVFRCFLLL